MCKSFQCRVVEHQIEYLPRQIMTTMHKSWVFIWRGPVCTAAKGIKLVLRSWCTFYYNTSRTLKNIFPQDHYILKAAIHPLRRGNLSNISLVSAVKINYYLCIRLVTIIITWYIHKLYDFFMLGLRSHLVFVACSIIW